MIDKFQNLKDIVLSNLKSGLNDLWENKHRIIAACFVLLILLSTFHYLQNISVASVQMSLNYSEAADGLNPNSTRFNIHEFTSEDVMQKAIDYAGLNGEIDPKELSECIYIQPVNTSGMDSSDYIVTTYYIAYDSGKSDIKSPDALNTLKLICTSYKEYFLEKYGDNTAVLSSTTEDFSDGEPLLQLNAVMLRTQQLKRYVEKRIQENTSFTDEETGYSFLSIMKELNQLNNYDIPNASAYILETGVSSDRDSLIAMLDYKRRLAQLDYESEMGYYESDNFGIRIYDEAMSGIVLIPSIDKMDQYYMSRTKTALDTMAVNANSELGNANIVKKDIVTTEHTISQMAKGTSAADAVSKAEEYIGALNKSLDEISAKLERLDTVYIKYKTQNYLNFKYNVSSFLQKISIKSTVVELIVFMACCYFVFFVKNTTKRKKRNTDEKV